MRADRLVAILLLLQRRGHVTAAEVAAELEISERTARRDLDALGLAGLPVYSTQGRGGGWRLAGGGRTDLSGLSAPEARALFMIAGPRAETTPQVRTALRKLVRALPEEMRAGAESAATALHVDPTGWSRRTSTHSRPDPPMLDAVQHIVIEAQQAEIDYVDRRANATTRVVAPLGIVSKGNTWYLVAETEAGRRTFRVDRINGVRPTGVHAPKPLGFDLDAAWRDIAASIDDHRYPAVAFGRVDPRFLALLRWLFDRQLHIGSSGDDGWIDVTIRASNHVNLAREIAGMAAFLEITAPREVTAELAAIGDTLRARYANAAPLDQ